MPVVPTNAPLTPDEFLNGFPPQIQQLAQRLRRIVVDTAPNVDEAVYPGWRLIGYRLKDKQKSRYFCYIAPMLDHVRLGFEYGVLLTDERQILQGTGKQVRYIPLRHDQALSVKELTGFIAEAATHIMTRR